MSGQLASHHGEESLGVTRVHQAGGQQTRGEAGSSSWRLASEPRQELEGRGSSRGHGVLDSLLQGARREEKRREAQGNTRGQRQQSFAGLV